MTTTIEKRTATQAPAKAKTTRKKAVAAPMNPPTAPAVEDTNKTEVEAKKAQELKDNTHFNTFGAYEVAKCVIEGMKKAKLPIVKDLKADYINFDPSKPDKFKDFKWNLSPFTEIEKPDGN